MAMVLVQPPRVISSLPLRVARLTGCLLLFHLSAGTPAVEDNLISTLLSAYVSNARPPPSDAATTVKLGLFLLSIDDVEERLQTITVSGNMIATWNDSRLAWNASAYNGIDRVVLASTSVWKPDLALTDSIGDVFNGAYFSDYYGVAVDHSGLVTWTQLGSISVRCDFDLTYYPFDTQSCDLVYSSFNYPDYLLHLDTDQPSVEMDDYHENAEFSIINTTAYTSHIYYPGDGNFSSVIFSINMRRRELYFMLNLVFPCVLLTLLSSFLFLLPTSSGERVGVSMTVMLTFSVFQLLVSQNLPINSLYSPLLTSFIFTALCVNGLALVLTIFILRTAESGGMPMPPWVEKYLLYGAGVTFGLVRKSKNRVSTAVPMAEPADADKVVAIFPEQEHGKIRGPDEKAIAALLSSVVKIERSLTEGEDEERLARKWELVSKVIDIIMFILYIAFDIVFSVAFLVIMPAKSN